MNARNLFRPIATALGIAAIATTVGCTSTGKAKDNGIAVPTALPSDMLDLLRTIAENTHDTASALYTADGVPAIDLLQQLVDQGKVNQGSLEKLVGMFDKVIGDQNGNLWFCSSAQCSGTCYQRVSKEWSCRNGNAVSYNPPQGYTVCCTVNPGNNPIVIQNPNPGNGGSTSQGSSATGGSGTVEDVSGGSIGSIDNHSEAHGGAGGYGQGGSNGPIDNSSNSGGNTQYAYHGPTEIVIPITIEGSTTNVTINEGDSVIVEGDTYVIVTDGQTGENRRIERPNFCRRLNRLCREGNQNACNLYEDVCVKRVSPTEAASPNPPVEPTDKPDPQPTTPPQCVSIAVTGDVRRVDLSTARCGIRFAIVPCDGGEPTFVTADPEGKLEENAGKRRIVTVHGCLTKCGDNVTYIEVTKAEPKDWCSDAQPTSRPPENPTTPPQPSATVPSSSTPPARPSEPSAQCPPNWDYHGYGCEPDGNRNSCGLLQDCNGASAPSGLGWDYRIETVHLPASGGVLWFHYGNRPTWATFSTHEKNSDGCLIRYIQQGAGRYCQFTPDVVLEAEAMKELNFLLGRTDLFPNGIARACAVGPNGTWQLVAGSGSCP